LSRQCHEICQSSGFLQKCIAALEKLPDRDMLAGMGELLDEKKKEWVKTKLKTEAIFQLKLKKEIC